MGRYAYFYASGNRFEYKFWVGVQDSKIPWADSSHEYYIQEYDEDNAIHEGLTDNQKKIWEKWADTSKMYDDNISYSDDEMEVLERCSELRHFAHDCKENLLKYWDDTKKLISDNKLEPFVYHAEKDIEEQVYDYVDKVLDPYHQVIEITHSQRDIYKEQIASDINLKLLICCILERYHNYSCEYEW
jgi:hypothetical protein